MNHLYAPWYKRPILWAAYTIQFKITSVAKYSKKERKGKQKKNNPLQDVDKYQYQGFSTPHTINTTHQVPSTPRDLLLWLSILT